ncbi:sensor histidine kinase [Nocardioides kribbensis]|uniref:sensor histidine kinase n=1 Tax=Nocardioides kribbensis TaxID=305517 RepID=UPI00187A8235|nr:ATP-binding protein [Nocardioides kribbensis]
MIVGVSQHLGDRAARAEALQDARATTELLARSVAGPAVPRGLVDGVPGAVDRFDRTALARLVGAGVRRVKVWSADGTVLYSDDVRLIGMRFELGEDEQRILAEGGTDAEVSDLSAPENRFEAPDRGLIEVYTRLDSPEGEPLLFETYYSSDLIATRSDEVVAPFQRINLLALALVVAVATGLLYLLNRRIRVAGLERERLMDRAAAASEAERRRIARDLHDGVVQDLAATAFGLSTLARRAEGTQRRELLASGAALRRSMRDLRSLLVEIHPPGLTATTLPSALADLVAPLAAAGIAADVEVGDLDDVDEATLGLVWRVAQEAVRNALRHARASTVRVRVGCDDATAVLEVVDDGAGFRADVAQAGSHYGLRGLRSLAEDHGGRLTVESSPGAGTTVRLEVRR